METIDASHKSAHAHLQDSTVINGHLHTLWDHQGQAAIEILDISMLDISNEPEGVGWCIILYPFEPDLTPAYLDKLFLSPSLLMDMFFSAIMHLGIFSTYTLCTTIDQYTNVCRLLPSSPPAPLIMSYVSLGEKIPTMVGCTVTLSHDTQTGALLYNKYWISLKQDWEGFIACCCAVKHSMCWSLALGMGPHREVLVAKREHTGTLAVKDLPLRLHHHLHTDLGAEPQFAVCEITWNLRT